MNAGTAFSIHRFVARLALCAGNVFAWVLAFAFFYARMETSGMALAQTALLYALSQAVTCLKLPACAERLRHGMRILIVYAVILAAAAMILLGAALNGLFGGAFWLGMIGFAIFLGAYRALYRLPYKLESREINAGSPSPIGEMLVALAPAVAGMVLVAPFQSAWFLYGVGILLLLAAAPLAFIPDSYEKFPWGYQETFSELFARENRRLLRRALLRGFEGTALFLLWPIVVFLLLGGSYAALGLIFSLTLLVAIMLHDAGKELLRRWRLHDSVAVEAAIAASAWLGRLTVLSPVSVVLVDSYAYLGSPREHVPPAHFEQVVDGNLYLDERTVLKEMGESLGRIVACIVAVTFALACSATFAFVTCFVLAACAAAGSVFLNRIPARSL